MEQVEVVALAKARVETIPILRGNVHGIEELEEAILTPVAKLKTPSAYVILLSDEAAPDENITVPTQRVTITYGIVTAIANTTNPLNIKSGGTVTDMQKMRSLIIANQLGWEITASGSCDPVTYRRGRMVRVSDGVLWWQFEFMTAQYIRSEL